MFLHMLSNWGLSAATCIHGRTESPRPKNAALACAAR
jgi:hypothetical protein